MCGIVGGWVRAGVDPQSIERSLDSIRHRGPDDSGLYVQEAVFIGNRRLSIIDLEGGKQPIANEDGSVRVVFNGEIYNYLELIADLKAKGHSFGTVSDTECLVHLYEEYGTDMCESLRGMFAFAIWDERSRMLYLARDRFGKKPLYYLYDQRFLLFASELKALRPLAQSVGREFAIRDQAIFDYLSLGFIPQPDTVFQGVYSLGPGEWMLFDGENLKTGKFWDLQFVPKSKISYKDALEHTRELVSESVRLRLRSDVPLGIFLSGGMDSSVIAYEAALILGESLNSFTVKMLDSSLDESDVAARTSMHLNIKNTILPLKLDPLNDIQEIIRIYDQPFADPSAIPAVGISKLAAEHVKVVLNGDGGDEIFAGYRRYLAARYVNWLAWIPSTALNLIGGLCHLSRFDRRSIGGFAERVLRGAACDGPKQYLDWTLDMMQQPDKVKGWIKGPVRPTEDWLDAALPDGLSSLDTILSGDIRIILLSDLLVKMDMATMAASIEARSPLMDHELAEFAATLPESFKINGGITKALLRDAYSDALPREVIRGPKRGFEPPLAKWLAEDLEPLLMDTLGSESALVKDYLDGAFIQKLLDRKTGLYLNVTTLTYALLILELWLRHFKQSQSRPSSSNHGFCH